MLSMNFTPEWAETRSPAAAPAAYLCDEAWPIIKTQESGPVVHGVMGQRQEGGSVLPRFLGVPDTA